MKFRESPPHRQRRAATPRNGAWRFLLLFLIAGIVASSTAGAPLQQHSGDKVEVRPPLERPQRPAGEAETQWRLVGSPDQPESVLDQDPIFQLHRLLARWSDAWANKRVDEYLSYYSERFSSSDFSTRAAWAQSRRERLARPDFIRIEIGEVVTDIDANGRASVRFRQSYQADHYRDQVVKTLVVEREAGGWKIVSEVVSP